MNKRVFCLILAMLCALTLTACGCKHETWNEADCTTPKTCAECGEIEGAPLGHVWTPATCETAKTCEVCGVEDGTALGHAWVDAACESPKTCANCGLTEGEALGHVWEEATTEAPITCSRCGLTEGERIITDPRFTTASTKALYGTWVCTYEMGTDALGLDGFTGTLPMKLFIEFTNDGHMHISVDIVDPAAFLDTLYAYMKELIYAELEEETISREEVDDLIQSAYGMTMDEYVMQYIDAADLRELFVINPVSGVYYVEGNTLYSGESWSEEMGSNTFSLNDGLLTMDGLAEDLGLSYSDLTFTKVPE